MKSYYSVIAIALLGLAPLSGCYYAEFQDAKRKIDEAEAQAEQAIAKAEQAKAQAEAEREAVDRILTED